MSKYTDVTWGTGELVSSSKLNKMSSSIKYLKENAAVIQYTSNDQPTRAEGMKIACGIVPSNTTNAPQMIKTIFFGNYFTPGCQPVIVTSLSSPGGRHYALTIQGIGAWNYKPDHTGFTCVVQAIRDNDPTITSHFPWPTTLHWIAIGW